MAYDGREIRQARQRARLTQRQLAERIGGSERAVTRWERDGVPDGAHNLAALEEVLQLGPAAHPAAAEPPLAAEEIKAALKQADDLELLAEMAQRLAERHSSKSTHVGPPGRVKWQSADAPSARRAKEPGERTEPDGERA